MSEVQSNQSDSTQQQQQQQQSYQEKYLFCRDRTALQKWKKGSLPNSNILLV